MEYLEKYNKMNQLVELVKDEEWYQSLIDDCKSIITEAVFISRWALVEGYHQLGKRIRDDEKWEKYSKGAYSSLQGLAKNLNLSDRTLYYAVQFYDKYPELDKVPEGKNVTWNKICNKYLPESKDKPVIPLPEGEYNIFLADPPWQFNNSGFTQSAASIYPTMSTEEICKLPIKNLILDNSVLFLWATNAMLPDALNVIEEWGFTYKSNIVWIKDKAPGMGWFTESKHELLLIGVNGAGLHPIFKPQSWVKEDRTEHSKKPEIFYEIIEKMYPGQKYIELFARKKRDGWKGWGNEIPEN